MEDGRFLDFDGVCVPKYKPANKLTKAWRAVAGHIETPETLSCGMVTAFAIAANPSAQNAGTLAAVFAVASVISKAYARLSSVMAFKRDDLYFDINPAQVNNKEEHIRAAKRAKTSNLIMGTTQASMGLALAVALGFSVGGAVVSGTWVATSLANAHRFNKAIKGDWQITDIIPQQEEKEAKTDMVPVPS